MKKLLIAFGIFLLVLWLSSYIFNYIDVWIAWGVILIDIVVFGNYIYKQIKKKYYEKSV